MQKLAKRISIVMVALFTLTTLLSFAPAKAATAVKPIAKIAQQPNATYTQGDILNMKLQAPNYKGKVEYKVVIENLTTKNVVNLFGSANLGYYTKTQPSGLYAFPIHWAFNDAGSYRVFVYVRPANSKIAMSSYVVSTSFTATAKVDAEAKVAAYEKAPLDTVDQIAAADGLKTAAVEEVAKVTDATAKAAFQARIDAQAKKVDEARYVHVKSVAAINVNTFVVTFNKDVAATNRNFVIYPQDNKYGTLLVKSVSVNKNVATVTVYDTLTDKKVYTVETSGVTSADTKFVMKEMESQNATFNAQTAAASIAFTSTSIHFGDTLGYIIKDANGNDITPNFVLGTNVLVETTDNTVVNGTTLVATAGPATSYAIVNLKIKDTTVQTGNTIITVSDNDASKLTQLGRYSIGDTLYSTPNTTLYTDDAAAAINFELLDQNGKAQLAANIGNPTYQYISSNPTVAVVNAASGLVYPLQPGTANITVIATVKSGTTTVAQASKTYTVTVKDARKATTISVAKTNSTVVGSSNIADKVHVKVLDQYGNVFKTAAANLVGVTASTAGIATTALSLTNGEGDLVITPTATNGTTNLTLAATGLNSVVVAVSNVAASSFNGYAVTTDSNTLDISVDPDLSKGPLTSIIHVYKVDINGNKYLALDPTLATPDFTVVTTDATKGVLDLSTNGTVAITKTGTESVYVKVGTGTIATLSFTVVNSNKTLTTVSKTADTLSAKVGDTDLLDNLFGTFVGSAYTAKGVFVGYDQYNNEAEITPYTVVTADSSIIAVANDASGNTTGLTVVKAGKVTLVVKILDKYYTVDVNVTN